MTNDAVDQGSRLRVVVGMLLALGAGDATLLWSGQRDFLYLHTILDTAVFLLSGILSLLLADVGKDLSQPLLRRLAVTFGIASLLELLHVLAQETLRPSFWSPAAYCLAVGTGLSVGLTLRRDTRARWFGPTLILFTAAIYPALFWLPRYTAPQLFGITRPELILVPPLWLLVCWLCWRLWQRDQIIRMAGQMGAIQCIAQLCMLYSRSSHDGPAMAAHLGKVVSDLVFLALLTNMCSIGMRRLMRAEASLSELNLNLEQHVRDRTAQLEASNQRLELEMGERERTQHRLQESRRLLQAILDNSPTIIFVKDLSGRYLLVNRGFSELFHLKEDEPLTLRDFDILPPEIAKAQRALDVQVATSQKAEVLEETMVIDGRPRTYLSVRAPLAGRTGTPLGVCVVATDITERKVVERRLHAQLGRMNLLHRISRAIAERQGLSNILEAVVSHIESDLPLAFACACLYDSGAHQLTVAQVGPRSRALSEVLLFSPGAHIPIDKNGLSRCCTGGELVYEADIAHVPFDFPRKLANAGLRALVVAPLQLENKVFGTLIAARREAESFSSGDCEFLRQLSEHVAVAAHQAQLYAALEAAYNDLRLTQEAAMQHERLSALGQMASGVAHDINNAITPIALYAETMLEFEKGLSPQARDYLQVIDHAIHDVAQTITRLRAFYQRHEPTLAATPVQLNELIDQVASMTRARWSDIPQQRGVVIALETEPAGELPWVQGDESEIREALINLVFNAVDALPDGGQILLRTGVELGTVFVEVADNGTGMDEETRRRCLEPFFTTKGASGSGLGLAMVYGMAERHGARVDIHSERGRGTRVRLLFPILERAALVAEVAATVPEPITPLRVLVVDDDPAILRSLRDVLELDGHSVVTANGGQEGIDAFRSAAGRGEPFELVVTDLGMPFVDGRRVAEAIREHSPATPIILLTGWGQRLISDGEIPPHVNLVLGKPPQRRRLREAITQCCMVIGAGKAPVA
jgi:PAS domain S-box-containing protein